jgi:hypothetical protein
MAQFARPDSDITQTSFTGGFSTIDESVASDADFAYGANNTAAELEVGLSNVTDPNSSTGHVFRYRIARTNAGVVDGGGNAVTVTARLMQGTTQIATDTAKTATGTWTQYAYTLSAAEADAITNYNDLRLEFLTSGSGGSPAVRRGGAVSWAEFEVPDAAAGQQYNSSPSGSLSFGGAIIKRAARALTASLSFAGSTVKQTARSLSGSLGFSAETTKSTTRTVGASVTFTASLDSQVVTPALVAIHIHTE